MMGLSMENRILKSFCFIRHGETDWNKNLIYQGQNDVPLNENGIAQARRRAKSMSFGGFTEIFSSPLARAKQTAEIIGEASSKTLRIIEIPELMECGSEESARYVLGLKQVQQMPSFEKATNLRESPKEFFDRVERGLNYVFQTASDSKPLIVAHGGVCVAFCMILGLEFFSTPNCSLVDFKYDGKRYSTNHCM